MDEINGYQLFFELAKGGILCKGCSSSSLSSSMDLLHTDKSIGKLATNAGKSKHNKAKVSLSGNLSKFEQFPRLVITY